MGNQQTARAASDSEKTEPNVVGDEAARLRAELAKLREEKHRLADLANVEALRRQHAEAQLQILADCGFRVELKRRVVVEQTAAGERVHPPRSCVARRVTLQLGSRSA